MDALQLTVAIGTTVNAIAVVVLVVVTWRYARATESLLERVDKQIESATKQSEMLTLTAEILARSGLVQAHAGDNSMTVLKMLAADLAKARDKRKPVVP